MKHLGTKVLKTERLCLRRFIVADANAMFENWASNANVTRFLTWHPHDNVNVTRSLLAEWVKGYEKPDFYQWAIEVIEIGQPIGSISVVRINEAADEVEIGYCIGEKWWGKGYVAEALDRLIDFLFHEINVRRICAKHDVANPNSGKVMQKCGMQYEGTLQKAGRNITNGFCDVKMYSINKETAR